MAELLTNPREKIRYYRRAAAEAEQSALHATDEGTRQAYFSIMKTWIYLAEELEREIELGIAYEEPPEDGQSEDLVIPPRRDTAARKSH